jgi:hypothetical protein
MMGSRKAGHIPANADSSVPLSDSNPIGQGIQIAALRFKVTGVLAPK